MMHYAACVVQPVLEILGSSDNVPRKEMEEIAGRVGLSFIVNTVLDEAHRIVGVFSGHYVEAHRKGAELADRVMVVPIPRQADILVVSANPCHFDYWQGIKPYAYAHRAVREGGAVILMLDGEEHLCGDAPSHEPTLRRYMSWSFEDMKREVEEGRAEDIVGMNVPMYHATLAHRTANLLVTNHMTDEEVAVLGFERQPTVQDALERAFGLLGGDARVGVIPFGGETLTRVDPGTEPPEAGRK
jgi:nickel-dependent lactate racemase